MAWATAQDVLDAWIGEGKPDDAASLTLWVGRAERLIRSKVKDLQARIDAGTDPDLLETARDVVTDMVIRKFKNPEGLRQVSEGSGPFNASRTYGGDEPGSLYITDDELANLSGGSAGSQRAFTIDTIPATSPFSPNYVAVDPWLSL